MQSQIMQSLSGILAFLAYFGGAIGLLVVFAGVYGLVTPYSEHTLIREGKTAPAVSLGGALLGFACPLVSAIAHSVSLLDMIIWALIALVIQVLAFIVLRLFFGQVIKGIAEDKMGPAAFVAFVSVVVWLLNAASMTN